MNFRILAWLWWFVSIPAAYLLWRESAWMQAPAGLERLRAVRLEQWVALALILFHGILFIRALTQPKANK